MQYFVRILYEYDYVKKIYCAKGPKITQNSMKQLQALLSCQSVGQTER